MRFRILVAPIAAALSLHPATAADGGTPANRTPSTTPAPSANPVRSSSPPPRAGAYRPPVDRSIIEPFRAPPTPYAAGHRGIDYGTVPGESIRAIGDGTVTFAGPVARERYVTVRHPDGLDSTYAYLASITVRRGQHVRQGDQVGTAGPILHLGVRRDGRYLDPSTLFRPLAARRRPILVPPPSPRSTTRRPSAVGEPEAHPTTLLAGRSRPDAAGRRVDDHISRVHPRSPHGAPPGRDNRRER